MRKSQDIVAAHMNQEELLLRMKKADCIEQLKRYQVIYLRLTNPDMSVSQIASLCGVAYRTVTQWTWYYNRHGAEKYMLSGKGGRRNAHLSEEEEISLLNTLHGKAEKGYIVTVQAVKKAAEKLIGHELPKDYAYDLLHRNKWRKIMPHTYHPNRDAEKQESFKKTSKSFWLPPEKS